MTNLKAVEAILKELRGYGLTDRQIANSIGVNRVTINRLRNGKPNRGETGVSYLPDLRKLLADIKQQIPETRQVFPTQVTPTENAREYSPEPPGDVRSEVRGFIERTPKQSQLQKVSPKVVQEPLPLPTCAMCGIQKVRLFRKSSDLGMGSAFIYVCAKCFKKPANPQVRLQGQVTIPTPHLTRTTIPWNKAFKRKDT